MESNSDIPQVIQLSSFLGIPKSSNDFMLVPHKDICTFIDLFTVVNRCLPTDKCMRNTYVMDFYLLAKKNEIMAFSRKSTKLKIIK